MFSRCPARSCSWNRCITSTVRVWRATPRVLTVCVNQSSTACRSVKDRALAAVIGSSMMIRSGCSPVPTPPTDVAMRQPPAAVFMRVFVF